MIPESERLELVKQKVNGVQNILQIMASNPQKTFFSSKNPRLYHSDTPNWVLFFGQINFARFNAECQIKY